MEPNKNYGAPGEYYFQPGVTPVKEKDLKVNTTLRGVVDYAAKRKSDHTIAAPWHIQYCKDPEVPHVALICGEFGGSRSADGPYIPAATITGNLQLHPFMRRVKEELLDKARAPRELGEYLRKQSVLFADSSSQASAVTAFRTMATTVTTYAEDTKADSGDRRLKIEATVKKSVEDFSIQLTLPAYVGEAPIKITVEFVYDVSGFSVTVTPICPLLEKHMADVAEGAIDRTIGELKKVFETNDGIPFMEVYAED